MSVRVMSWVWASSKSRSTARLVLLAIADCANDRGTDAYPSTATLAAKTGLSERGVRGAVSDLETLGELKVDYKRGPNGCNRYRVLMTDPEQAATSDPAGDAGTDTRHDVHSAPRAGTTRQDVPGTRQDMPLHPARRAPEPSSNRPPTEPSVEPSKAVAIASDATPANRLSVTQRSKRITDAYTKIEPLSKWPAINGIVIKAIQAERWSDDEIRAALLRLAAEGRGVTVETLRVELNGLPPARAAPKPSTTNSRVGQALDIADELEREGFP